MKSLLSLRSAALAALVLGGFAVASAAHARSDVQFSIGFQLPGVYTQPAQVYVQPAPVYVQPRQIYVQPQPVYFPQQPYYVQQPVYAPRHGRHHNNNGGRYDPRADWDRDGVPNRYDRAPTNPWYR